MCYWVGTKKVREQMLQRLGKNPQTEIPQLFYDTFEHKAEFAFPSYFVAIGKASPQLAILTNSKDPGLKFVPAQWGLPWSYTQEKTGKSIHHTLINTTSEKAFFMHRDIISTQRCIIPIDGYYEFFHFAGQVYPHFIQPKNGIFWAGGLWKNWENRDTGEITKTFSIITTPPNKLASKLHNNPKAPNGSRMLLLIPEELTVAFLEHGKPKNEIEEFFTAFPDNLMEAYPVTRFLRKEFDHLMTTEKVRERIDYPELALAF